jgi:trans-aconitate 2-methyltransferase
MLDWDATQYLKFEDERTRAARDLLAQVPLHTANCVYDLGCGPANSTELLVARFPGAEITGVDSSPEMLAKAKKALPSLHFIAADLTAWTAEKPADLLFANAVFQWLPDHLSVLERLLGALPSGGILAVQMPDNLGEPSQVLMREIAETGPFAAKLTGIERDQIAAPEIYYDRLKPLCASFDIWHTIYNHALAGPEAIVEWLMGTGLRPYLAPLDEAERTAYLAAYLNGIKKIYIPRADGRVLLRFPRIFMVAVRA